jgi:hypothetical protein
MDEKKVFGLFLRGVGVTLIIWGIWYLLAGLSFIFFKDGSSLELFWYGIPAIYGGHKLLFHTDKIVNASYQNPT